MKGRQAWFRRLVLVAIATLAVLGLLTAVTDRAAGDHAAGDSAVEVIYEGLKRTTSSAFALILSASAPPVNAPDQGTPRSRTPDEEDAIRGGLDALGCQRRS